LEIGVLCILYLIWSSEKRTIDITLLDVFRIGNVYGMWNSYKNLHQREFLGNVKIMKPQEVNMAFQGHRNPSPLTKMPLAMDIHSFIHYEDLYTTPST